MKQILNITAAIFVLSMIFSGCSTHPPLQEMEPEEIYSYFTAEYSDEDYFDAAEGFDYFTLNYSGHALVDSAQYLLSLSHFHMKEYILAASLFDELTRRFPSSKLVPEAMFMKGKCFWELSPKYSLDQKYTREAIEAMQTFIDYFPEYEKRVEEAQKIIDQCREKLAHKEYANGILYRKMKNFDSAEVYFRIVLDRYYDTDWAPRALYYLGISLSRQDKKDEARQAYETFLEKYPDHSWESKVRSALSELDEEDAGGFFDWLF